MLVAVTAFLLPAWGSGQVNVHHHKVLPNTNSIFSNNMVLPEGANVPVCNLFNSAGLPASPFRTDVNW